MSKATHTPGPWRIETENETGTPTISIRDGLNQQIATVNPYRLAWRDADAALIAAAPEMYDLLERLATDEFKEIAPSWHDDILEVLAKARGES